MALDYVKSMLKLIPNVGQSAFFLDTVQKIEAMNLEAQTKTLCHIFQERGMEDDAVGKLLADRIQNEDRPYDYYVTYIVSQLLHNTDTKQTEVETRAFCDFLDRKIEWDDFCVYCSVVHEMILMDFESLKKVKEKGGKIALDVSQLSDQQKVEYGRLEGIGLLTNTFRPKVPILVELDEGKSDSMKGNESEKEYMYELTSVGKKIGAYLD